MRAFAIAVLALCGAASAQDVETVPPTDVTVPGLDGFRVYPLIDRANRELAQGDSDAAMRFLERALRIAPDSESLRMMAGIVELQRDDPRSAIEQFDAAIELDRTSARSFLYRGLVRLQAYRLRSGLDDIDEALRLGDLDEEEETRARRAGRAYANAAELLPDPAPEDGFGGLREHIASMPPEQSFAILDRIERLPDDLVLRRARLALLTDRSDITSQDLDTLDGSDIDAALMVPLHRLASEVRSARGRHAAATRSFLVLLEAGELDDAGLVRATTSARAVQDEPATARFLRARLATASDADRPRVLEELAGLIEADGDLPGATALYRRLATDRAADAEVRSRAWSKVADIAARTGDTLAEEVARDRVKTVPLPQRPAVGPSLSARAPSRPDAVQARESRHAEALARLRSRFAANECDAGGVASSTDTSPAADEATLLLDAADCFERLDDLQGARRLYRLALTRADELSTDQQRYAWAASAYIDEAQGAFGAASRSWQAAGRLADERAPYNAIALNAVRTARLGDEPARAMRLVGQIDQARLDSLEQRIAWYDEIAYAAEQGSPDQALKWLQAALVLDRNGYLHTRAARVADAAGRSALAAMHYEAALEFEPDNVETGLALGYAQLEAGDIPAATDTFERLVQARPADPEITLQYAYLQKQRRDLSGAARSFRRVIDLKRPAGPDASASADGPDALDALRLEILTLEKRGYLYGVAAVESGTNGASGPDLQRAGIRSTDSPALLEAGWYPLALERMTGTRFTLFARTYGTMNDRFARIDEGSGNIGVGVRWNPFAGYGLAVQGQRLIGVDDDTSDGWLATTAYDWSRGTGLASAGDSWNSFGLYAEASYLSADADAKSAFAEVSAGRAFRLFGNTVLVPHAVGSAQSYSDRFDSRSGADAGVGVGARFRFGADAYRSSSGQVDFSLQYRVPVIDRDEEQDKVVAKIVVGM